MKMHNYYKTLGIGLLSMAALAGCEGTTERVKNKTVEEIKVSTLDGQVKSVFGAYTSGSPLGSDTSGSLSFVINTGDKETIANFRCEYATYTCANAGAILAAQIGTENVVKVFGHMQNDDVFKADSIVVGDYKIKTD